MAPRLVWKTKGCTSTPRVATYFFSNSPVKWRWGDKCEIRERRDQELSPWQRWSCQCHRRRRGRAWRWAYPRLLPSLNNLRALQWKSFHKHIRVLACCHVSTNWVLCSANTYIWGTKWNGLVNAQSFAGHMGSEYVSREKKLSMVNFLIFGQKNVSTIRFQEIKIRPFGDFEKMRFLCFYIIRV